MRDVGGTRVTGEHRNTRRNPSPLCSPQISYGWARIAQSVQRLATGWTARGSNPGGGQIFHTRPHRAWGPPSLLYNGYWVFSGGEAAGEWR